MIKAPFAPNILEIKCLIRCYVLHKISNARVIYTFISNTLKKSYVINKNSDNQKESYRDIQSATYYDDNLSLRKMSDISKYMMKRWDSNRVIQRR
jgi:hypothetical protein